MVNTSGLVATTFESILTLVVIGLVGFIIIKRKLMPEETLGFLSPLALDIALPALVFVNIISKFDPRTYTNWYTLPLWWAGFQLFAGIMTWLCFRLAGTRVRREFAISLFYQNGMFIPIAVITGIFGKESPHIVTLILFTLFYPSFFFSTYHLFFDTMPQKKDWRKIFNNILIMTVIATLIKLASVSDAVPRFFTTSLSMIGGMAIPVLILIIGGNIYVDFKHQGKLVVPEIIKFVLIKNILFPLAMAGLLFLIRPSYEVALMMIIQSAVPPVTAIPIVVDRAGGNRNIVNQFMVASFIASLGTLPLVMLFFEGIIAS